MSRQPGSVVVVGAALLLAALVFVGCGAAGSPASPGASGSTSSTTTAPGPTTDPAPGSVVDSQLNTILGRPTDSSIAISLMLDPGTQVTVDYGTTSGAYTNQTVVETAGVGAPVVFDLTSLQADTRYYYRPRFRTASQSAFTADAEHSFHTKRQAGSTFTFGVQGDSHPERVGSMFNADLYTLNLRNVAARRPDFYFCLGDDFSLDPMIDKNQLTEDGAAQLYQNQRKYLAVATNQTALFLVNGNHEDAAAYLLSDRYVTPYRNAAIYAGRSRITWFPLPPAAGFYSGDTTEVSGIGQPRDYYAFEWGDALFVTIDPYWHSPVPVDTAVSGVASSKGGWEATIGDDQYAWLKRTLESSHATYKFVFEHHVLGTGRGAAALVHQFEWGGYNQKGTSYEFTSYRPAWTKPIHQLFKDNHVAIFFFGHDHLFAREKVDGVVYQSVPNPADSTYSAFNADAYVPSSISLPGAVYDRSYGVTLPNTGFLSVTVSPDGVTVSYVRAVLTGDESKAGTTNGAIAYSYTVAPVKASAAARQERQQ